MNVKQTLLAGVMVASSALTACASQAYVAYQVPAPPSAPYVVGAVGYAPGPGFVWVDGFWDLRGGRRVSGGGRLMGTLFGCDRIGSRTATRIASIADAGDNVMDGR